MPVLKNLRWEKYVQSRIAGMTQRKAYCEAYPSAKRWKPKTVDNKAYVLDKKGEVLARYKELKEQAQDEAIMTRKSRMVRLSEIAQDEMEDASIQIKAIDTLNKMDGDYVNKVELSGEVKSKNPFEGLTTEELRKMIRDG